MIKLSIEEKARRYDEAIEIAKEINNEQQAQPFNVMTRVFPELRESEDERIRAALIYNYQGDGCLCTNEYRIDYKEIRAWLEKQGENNMGISEATKKKLEDNLNKALEKETPESCNEFLEKQGEQKQELLTKEKALKNSPFVEQKPTWSEEDEAIYYGVIETEQYMLDVVNGIKKFNVGNISIKEECTRELNWLKSLKDRIQPKPKQEWSEEDETVLNNLIYALANDRIGNNRDEYVDWLKSLRPQKHWKPSDEQMDMLAKMCSTLHLTYGENEIMESIYDALKKLKV
jgi:hypothetical protein